MNFDIKPDDADYSRKCAQKRRELLNEKGVLIILDNFDAPADDDDDAQESYRRILRDFQNDFTDADIIITTRSDINEEIFVEEVSRYMPTTLVAACEDIKYAQKVQDIFMNTCMRVYTNVDIRGVELCGAMKNIVALAAGISAGLGYGDNAKAALITRGMAEITRLGVAMGCMEQTFSGLAGMGDLIVTATSMHSRNNKAGYLIG